MILMILMLFNNDLGRLGIIVLIIILYIKASLVEGAGPRTGVKVELPLPRPATQHAIEKEL